MILFTQNSIFKKCLFVSVLLFSFLLKGFAQHVVETDWVQVATGSKDVYATASCVDVLGNSYVTGVFKGTVDFDPSGSSLNLSAVGQTDVFVQKFNPSGNLIWTKVFGGSHIDESSAIVTDAAGGVYITGYYYYTSDFDPGPDTFNLTANAGSDAFALKLDANGDFDWAISLGGDGAGQEGLVDIKIDAQKNIYLTGEFSGTADFDLNAGQAIYTAAGCGACLDVFILKMDSSLNHIWSKVLTGTGWEYSAGLEIDANGNIYIGGIFANTVDFDPSSNVLNIPVNGGRDFFIEKLDSMGDFVWVKTLGGHYNDYLSDFCLDAQGNIYMIGSVEDSLDMDPGTGVVMQYGAADYLLQLDANGNYIRSTIFENSTGRMHSSECRIDADGFLYLLGIFSQKVDFDAGPNSYPLISWGSNDAYILKLASDGSFIWVRSFGSFGHEAVKALSLDQWGNLYISGGYHYSVDFDLGTDTLYHTAQGVLKDMYHLKLTQDFTPVVKIKKDAFVVRVFPNPASKNIFVESKESALQVALFDMNGSLLLEQNSLDNTIDLDVSKLPSASYLLRISKGEQTVTKKVIKQP
jgi:hypothetical protein